MKNSTTALATRDQTDYLTGIRAYAALGVFLVHAAQIVNMDQSTFLFKLLSFGKYGVIIFFVLSAFTICLSIDIKQSFSWRAYLIRRLFRILPLYIFILTLAYLVGGSEYYLATFSQQLSWQTLISHFSFINILDLTNRNNLLGVEWTIPIEICFYLILPLALVTYRKWTSGVYRILAVSFLLAFPLFGLLHFLYSPNETAFYPTWAVEKYLFTYACGVGLYVFHKYSLKLKFSNIHLLELIAALLIYLIFGDVHNYDATLIFTTLWSVGLIALASSKISFTKSVFENKVMVYMGNISYSFYLIHFLVLSILVKLVSPAAAAMLGLLISLILSVLTYTFIEKPTMSLGKYLTERFN